MSKGLRYPASTGVKERWVTYGSPLASILTEAFFGTPPVHVQPTGIASGEAVGTPTVVPGAAHVIPPGIASGEAVGTPTVIQQQFVAPTGIASLEGVGAPVVSVAGGLSFIIVVGIASGEAVGTPTIVQHIAPTGIASGEQVGTPNVAQQQFVSPAGIASAEAVGTPNVAIRQVITGAGGIASGEQVGTPNVVQGIATIAVPGIASAGAFGTPRVIVTATPVIAPAAIASGETFGTPTVTQAATVVAPAGIPSGAALGVPTVLHTTAGVPADPATGRPVRRASWLLDPVTNDRYDFAINHAIEDALTLGHTPSHGAPNLDVGVVRQQTGLDDTVLRLQGTALDHAQIVALEGFYDRAGAWPVIFHDADGDEYRVLISGMDVRRLNGQNHGSLIYWKWTLQLEVLNVRSGPLAEVIV